MKSNIIEREFQILYKDLLFWFRNNKYKKTDLNQKVIIFERTGN